jgi:hypothetical protein
MNTGLRLEVVELEYTTREIPVVTLLLENGSDDQVWFVNPTYGVRIFHYSSSDGEWTELRDHFVSASEGEDILVPREQGINWGAIVSVAPDITNLNRPVEVRIVVVGRVYQQNLVTDDEIGAYIDVLLPP